MEAHWLRLLLRHAYLSSPHLAFVPPSPDATRKTNVSLAALGMCLHKRSGQLAYISPMISDLLAGNDMPLSATRHLSDGCGKGRLGREAGGGMRWPHPSFKITQHTKPTLKKNPPVSRLAQQ